MTNSKTSGNERPLATFALFAYNQERYIREAVKGAFAQTYEPLEIILSDDRSADRTFEIMQEMAAAYDGPHKVTVRQSEVNKGTLSHVLSVAREASGEFFATAAGDDISFPERISKSVECMSQEDVIALSGADIVIDDEGHERDWAPERLAQREAWHGKNKAWLSGATAAYRTEFLQGLPEPTKPVLHEDVVFMDLISALKGKSQYLKQPLVRYRHHLENVSERREKIASSEEKEAALMLKYERLQMAKNYTVNCIALFKEQNIPVNDVVAGRLQKECHYFSLLSKWKNLGPLSKFKLFYHAYGLGRVKKVLPRLFGQWAFSFFQRLRS